MDSIIKTEELDELTENYLEQEVEMKTKRRKRKQYSEENMKIAIAAVKEQGMKPYAASKKYNVAFTTLKYKVSNLHTGKFKETLLTEEQERNLYNWIQERSSTAHLPIKHILKEAKRILDTQNPQFNHSLPSGVWYQGFKNRMKNRLKNENDDSIHSSLSRNRLDKNIIPAEFDMMICRFCIEVTNDNQRSIPSKFYSEFERLTGVELDQSNKYPKVLCENCYEKFTDILNYLQAISSNQTKLQKMFDGSNLTLNLQDYRHQNSNSSEYQLFQEIEPIEEFIIKQEPPEIECEVFACKNENVFADDLENLENSTFSIHQDFKELMSKSNQIKSLQTKYPKQKLLGECDICGYSSNSIFKVKNHVLEHHLKGYYVQCPFCPKKCKSFVAKRYHIATTHEKGEFKCKDCDQTFEDRTKLKAHFVRIHAPKVMCTYCGEFFNSYSMVKHKRIHNKVTVRCEFCGKEMRPHLLRAHLKEVHEEDEQTCEICGSIFGNKKKLKKHIARQHSESKLKCPVTWCSYTSARKPFIKLHLDHHRDIEQDEKDRLWLEVKKIKGFWT